MATQNGAIEQLIQAFGRLPGVGAKTAERLAHHILKCPPDEALALADAIRGVKERVRHCEKCFNLTDHEQPLCALCRDSKRDQGVVCVVEQPRDLMAIESAGTYNGVYHVLLGRLAPLQGSGPEQLTIQPLMERVRSGEVREVIMATNPNLEGDGTSLYLANCLAETGVTITRLARGLASGSVLEFANKAMLADALTGRQRF
ncbi:MAG TPA: recombination mediator RecR [Isosphaeraceae bacterium]|nr:recombination mediator RecR [Isosphaeraceae bacterium]